MAYGKIKADTLVYDNGGSDAEKTVASLAASAPTANPTFTGTATFNNLTVNGTTTTINSTTLTVDDKNIVLGSVDTPTDTTADGGGITLKGASDKEFKWENSTDAWLSSEHIKIPDDKKLLVGSSGDTELYHNGSHTYLSNTEGSLFIKSSSQVYIQDDQGRKQITCIDGGAVELYHGGVDSVKLATSSTGVTVSGSVTDSKGDVRNIPANVQSSAVTLAASDAGKVVATSSGGWVIPASTFAQGNAVTLLNRSNSDQTINATALTTLYNTADGANVKASTLTLGARTMATLWFDDASTAYIQAAALTVS